MGTTGRGFGVALLLLCAGAVAACGGGDGEPIDLFAGPYWMYELEGWTFTQSNFVSTKWGTAYSDGEGGFTTDLTGRVIGPQGVFDGTYVLAADRAWSARYPGATREMGGGMSPLGRCVVAGQLRVRDHPGIAILLGRVGGFDDSSLTGAYHMVAFVHTVVFTGNYSLCEAELTFDGAGDYVASTCTANREGLISTGTPEVGLTYSVASNGLLVMDDFSGTMDMEGCVLAGGHVAVAAGGTGEDQDAVFNALLKVGSGLSDASLDGEFWIVGLQHGSEGFRSLTGTLDADGAGAYTFTGMEKVEDEAAVAASEAGSYAVASDGTFTLTTGDGATLAGGLSDNAAYFALGGGTTMGDDPVFFFGVRK